METVISLTLLRQDSQLRCRAELFLTHARCNASRSSFRWNYGSVAALMRYEPTGQPLGLLRPSRPHHEHSNGACQVHSPTNLTFLLNCRVCRLGLRLVANGVLGDLSRSVFDSDPSLGRFLIAMRGGRRCLKCRS
jgi:hypothetical protein